jgi:SAM-dependent methyltransferase
MVSRTDSSDVEPRPMRDRTADYDYQRLLEEEKEHYSHIEVTEGLKEGGVHASSAWQYYWEGVARRIAPGGFADLAAVLGSLGSPERTIEVLSLGSGYCGHEIDLARRLPRPYRVRCTDINEGIFERARKVAGEERLALEFGVADLNNLRIEPGRFDLILAHASLHHVINLEQLFEQVAVGLSPRGIFHVVEVVGENRKLIWDENQRYANALLDLLPPEVTGGVRLAVGADAEGMEGIRQQDILPLLHDRFQPAFELRHGAFMRFVCTHTELAAALDPGQPDRRRLLDFLVESDECAVRHGVLRPLELWGVYRLPRAR